MQFNDCNVMKEGGGGHQKIKKSQVSFWKKFKIRKESEKSQFPEGTKD